MTARMDAPSPEGWFMVGGREFFRLDEYPVVKVSYEILSTHRTSAEAGAVCASAGACESCGTIGPRQSVLYPDTTFKVCAGCAPEPVEQGVLL